MINDKFKEPEVQRLIDKMQTGVESIDVVGNSFSLADYIKRMNKVMNADNEAYNTIPDSQNLIAQYLLLYEMSGDPDNLWKVVDYDYKKANVNVQLKSDNSKEVNRAIEKLDEYKDDFAKHNVNIEYAGSGYKALVFTDLILEGQIKSLLLSLLIIIVLLSIMFKKISIGLIGSIPITITAVISFGLMGLFGIPLSTTTALISSIAVGIGIDYAVHFIERYKIYALESGDKELTIKETMHHSGRAISFNAIVVIAGFLVLLFSVFPPNRSLGALVSLNMFTSFLGTVTIMFLVLYKSNVYFKKKRNSDENK
ncbi:MAG: MMPL family transporter [Melioribacteraceae bacterium]|nr:MMPL family transporter [Melioribacteraceae bacterium]